MSRPVWCARALLVAAATAAAASCGGHTTSGSDDWSLPNLGRASTRAAKASPITAKNVGRLHVAWRFPFARSAIPALGMTPESVRALVATPVVADGTVYVQDATSSVYAIARSSGSLRWKHRLRAPNYGRNGLSYSSGRLYGCTDTTVFALSAETGRMLWHRNLVTPIERFVDIAPQIANGLVYVSTVGYPPGGRGVIYALDARSGAIRWKFSTIRDPWRHPELAGGGGAWYTASVGPDGTVYSGVANPYPLGGTPALPNGGAYPGPVLYTDSLVALDGQTGRLLWHDQVTPHDVRDYDFQLPPILASVSIGGGMRDVILGAGKAGIVIAWDRATHERIWQTRVGRHLNDIGPLPAQTVEICPGFYGGVETPMAYADGKVFVPVVDFCAHGSAHGYQTIGPLVPSSGSGEFLALDAANGRQLWKRTLPRPDFGCATAATGVVFTSTFDGHVYGFDAATGATLWQAHTSAGINGCPALSGNMLFVPAGSKTTKTRPKFELVAYALRP